MKFLFLVLIASVVGSCSQAGAAVIPWSFADTAGTPHRQDGVTSEWPASLFSMDLGTAIKYAVDNDGENLYMALDIPNEGIQLKILRMGMSMYIDLKGKKKEGRGISFPLKEEKKPGETEGVKKDNTEEKATAQKKLQDKKVLRSTMALHLVYMNVFGFEGSPAHDQGLNIPGSINIAFSWDTLDVMHIEYRVPLKMLGDISSLDQKEISIGWKLNGMYPSDNSRYYSQQSGQPRVGADNNPIIDRETIVREQNIWKKYTVAIPHP